MNNLGFFTPIVSHEDNKSFAMSLLEKVDAYFYFGGKQAMVIKDRTRDGSQGVSYIMSTTTMLSSALKILSYITIVTPLICLALKTVLRSTHKFYVIDSVIERNFLIPSSSTLIVTKDSTLVRPYTGDFTSEQKKSGLKANLVGTTAVDISFPKQPEGLRVSIRKQDMFVSGAEVIVNAANAHLGGGGGIDGAIHTLGGDEYKKAHQTDLKGIFPDGYPSGYAAMIPSGNLKATHKINNVIVIAGPAGDSTPEKESQLYSCYYNALLLANSQNVESIAFPSISTGIFRFPIDRAANISLKAIGDFLQQNPNSSLKSISIHFLERANPENSLVPYLQVALH